MLHGTEPSGAVANPYKRSTNFGRTENTIQGDQPAISLYQFWRQYVEPTTYWNIEDIPYEDIQGDNLEVEFLDFAIVLYVFYGDMAVWIAVYIGHQHHCIHHRRICHFIVVFVIVVYFVSTLSTLVVVIVVFVIVVLAVHWSLSSLLSSLSYALPHHIVAVILGYLLQCMTYF